MPKKLLFLFFFFILSISLFSKSSIFLYKIIGKIPITDTIIITKKIVKYDTNFVNNTITVIIKEIEHIINTDTIRNKKRLDSLLILQSEQQLLKNKEKDSTITNINTDTVNTQKDSVVVSATKDTVSFLKPQKTNNNKLSIGAGIGFTINNINSSIPSDNYYQQLYSKAISNSYNIEAGFSLNKKISNFNFSFGSMLSYTSENFKNDNNINSNIRTVENLMIEKDTLDTYWKEIGEERVYFYVIRDDSIKTIDTMNINFTEQKNNYYFLELPISFGYCFNFNKFIILPSVFFSLSILLQSSDYAYDEEFFIEKQNNNLSPLNYNYGVSVNVSYQLSKRFSIFISSNYRNKINSIYKKDYQISKKYSSIGFTSGVSFDL